MSIDLHGMALVAVVAAVTMLIRFLPFLVFGCGRPTPRFITYLAGVLPCAIMAMLVVYCLRRCSACWWSTACGAWTYSALPTACRN